MNYAPELLLVGAVAGVGVLHTIVPDHWLPISLIARQRGWSKVETARAAFGAGTGHVLSTLLIGLVVWLAGVKAASRFGATVSTVSSLALITFGGWIAFSAWREMRGRGEHGHSHNHGFALLHEHGHEHGGAHDDEGEPADDPLYAPMRGHATGLPRHVHVHRHAGGSTHAHWHDHTPDTWHLLTPNPSDDPPIHEHRHNRPARTALVLILGSSPMIEGIPLFFTAGKYGPGLIAVMSVVFALSTITTYVVLSVYSTVRLQQARLGGLEQYGEVLSGAFIALVGVVFLIWPVL